MAQRSRPAVPPLDEPSPSDVPSPTDELIPPPPPPPAAGLTWDQPTTDPEPSPLPADEDSPSDVAMGELKVPDESPDTARRTSSRASSDSTRNPFSRDKLRETAREAVLSLGEFAHEQLARDEAAQRAQLWLADGEDAENIGEPLADAAHRHLGDVGEFANPDVSDLIAAGVGIAVYAWKQFIRMRSAMRMRRQALEQARPPEDPAEPPAAPPEPPAEHPGPPAPMGTAAGRYGLTSG